jgi:hypothetical protein
MRYSSRGISILILMAVLSSGTLQAETFVVDDSRSQVLDSNVRMFWESLAPGRGRSSQVIGQTTVIVRLDVAPWEGRQGRVFMLLPPRTEAAVEAQWTTRGPLQPGRLRSGERAMVFAGRIPSSLLEDTLVIRLSTDGDSLVRDESLQFSFEIEVEPQ